jgi:DNA repair exonuclease SbcCD ATPase subunit
MVMSENKSSEDNSPLPEQKLEDAEKKLSKRKNRQIKDAVEENRSSIKELQKKVQELKDQEQMHRLDQLSTKEQVKDLMDYVEQMDKESLQKKLQMMDKIQEEYEQGKVHEKLEFLYSEVQDLKDEEAQDMEQKTSRISEIVERLDNLEDELEEIKKSAAGDENNMMEELASKSPALEIENHDGTRRLVAK